MHYFYSSFPMAIPIQYFEPAWAQFYSLELKEFENFLSSSQSYVFV